MKPEPFGFLPGEVPAFPASPVLSARRFFALMASIVPIAGLAESSLSDYNFL